MRPCGRRLEDRAVIDKQHDPIGLLAAHAPSPDEMALHTSGLCNITLGDLRNERKEKLELEQDLKRMAMREHLLAQRLALAENELATMHAARRVHATRAETAPTEVEDCFTNERNNTIRLLVRRLPEDRGVEITMVGDDATMHTAITESEARHLHWAFRELYAPLDALYAGEA
jgi:hypothetical protein